MNQSAREIRHFFFSQYFSDGLRITLGVLLPSLLFASLGNFKTGFVISIGALLVSLTDSPGPVTHKRNAMLLCNLLIFLVALLTGYVRLNVYLLGLEVVLVCFFFSMFLVYGNRAAALGTAGIVVMILMLDQELKPGEVPYFSSKILAGGIWYMLLSLSFFRIRPYLQAQQSLGECIHEVSRFLRLKADFYRTRTDLEEDFRKVVAQQVVVNEKQDAVREVLLKSRQLVKESTATSRLLLLTFVDVMDLFEQIMTIHYDYASLRDRYGKTGVMDTIASLISLLADELDSIGFAIQSNLNFAAPTDLSHQLDMLKKQIDAVPGNQEVSNLALKKVLVNLRNLAQRIQDMQGYFNPAAASSPDAVKNLDFSRFVSHQYFDLRLVKDNLTFSSSIFRHSIRVALVCLFGFIITKLLPFGHYSYWVLLTIIVILKPAFSLTRQRNFERITGTIAGALLGVLVLYFIKDERILLGLMVLFMIGTYSFQRMNYIVSVFFMTPFVLILFHFMGAGEMLIVEERIVDTLIGSAIAFTASFVLFPSWESAQIQRFMVAMLKANTEYLHRLAEALSGQHVKVSDYKLARKEVYVSSANLSGAFQRMLSEPKSKQKNSKEVHKFVVLNHILSSYVATVASGLVTSERQFYPDAYLRSVKSSLTILNETIKKLEPEFIPEPAPALLMPPQPGQNHEELLPEQLEFIRKVSHDIAKITDTVVAHQQV